MSNAELALPVFLTLAGLALVSFGVICRFTAANRDKWNLKDHYNLEGREERTEQITIWGHRDIQPRERRP